MQQRIDCVTPSQRTSGERKACGHAHTAQHENAEPRLEPELEDFLLTYHELVCRTASHGKLRRRKRL